MENAFLRAYVGNHGKKFIVNVAIRASSNFSKCIHYSSMNIIRKILSSQDAQEFLSFLLEQISRAEQQNIERVQGFDTISNFQFALETRVECSESKYVRSIELPS